MSYDSIVGDHEHGLLLAEDFPYGLYGEPNPIVSVEHDERRPALGEKYRF